MNQLDEIRDAVEVCRNHINGFEDVGEVLHDHSIQVLIDLANRYLECSGVMPKKKDKCKICIPYEFCGCNNDTHNQAIDDCTLAITRKLEGLEDIIENNSKFTPISNDIDIKLGYGISHTIHKGNCIVDKVSLATAIRSHIVGDKTKGE